jgi:Ras-related protein Rab-8A
VVSTEEGQALANDFGIQFFETSAKNDINVEKAFVTIAREVRGLPCLSDHRHPHPTRSLDTQAHSHRGASCL